MADVLQTDKARNEHIQELLTRYGGQGKGIAGEEVIYGIYYNSAAPFWVRLNDFLIDHSKIPLKSKAYFFHLLAVMIDAGIPLLQSLQILKRREENHHFRRVINSLHYAVSQGKTLSDAMSRFSYVFTEAEIGVVKSGEAVGRLNQMLLKLSSQLDKSHELQMKLISAATYPLIVLGTLLLVGSAMLIWVIPNLLGILADSGLPKEQYPLPTVILLNISSFAQSYWWAIALAILLLYGIFQVYVRTATGRFKWDYFKLRVPVLGTLLRKVYVLRFISLLGVLIESGLPVIKALQIIATALDNQLYSLKVWQILAHVQQGQKISENLEASPFLFPETVNHMLSVGEKTASMGSISEKIGDYYDKEISHSLKRLTSLFEPLMIIFVALAVALIALAVLLPIFKLTEIV